MKHTYAGATPPLGTPIPDPALIVLIGAAGSGKSTWAHTWPSTQVLELDHFRAMVSDEAGNQDATDAAVTALHTVLEARLTRQLTTVIDATNTEKSDRARLLRAAHRHNMPTVGLLVPTPVGVCVDRQAHRTPDRAVPEDAVRRQYAQASAAAPNLRNEGFDHVVVADNIQRLEPLLQRASDTRRRELGWDGSTGLGGLLLVRRTFGSEVLPLWRWKDDSGVAGGDRVAEIRLGQSHLTLALRTDVDGEGDFGFDVMVPCPFDPECSGYAWAPAYSVSCLHRALTGQLNNHEDISCTIHGNFDDADQETRDHDQDGDPGDSASIEARYIDAARV